MDDMTEGYPVMNLAQTRKGQGTFLATSSATKLKCKLPGQSIETEEHAIIGHRSWNICQATRFLERLIMARRKNDRKKAIVLAKGS